MDMRIIIYDIEVFEYDWIVVFKEIDSDKYTVIHNDNAELRQFINQPNIVIGGFNNKHYDNYILKTIIAGGTNLQVKKHNDWIIKEKKPAWEFTYSQGYKIPCPTFDLKDDTTDPNLSLKAIEGNLKLPIIESSIPFDINRKLEYNELQEVIKYCKYDVDSTIKLYKERKENYIDAKILVAEMYNISSTEALGLTNAKLSSKVLNAKREDRFDERDYKIPPNIDLKLIPTMVYEFFMQITNKDISDEELFGDGTKKGTTLDVILTTSKGSCPITYAWGGVHGAKQCIKVEETKERVILNYDVSSLYPSSMINFGYCSRSMSDAKAYETLVKRRIGYKKAGDKLRANALKLIVNTVYGAMLNPYNDLVDKKAGRSVCITNQLAMTMLITKLSQTLNSIDFININTDGVMFELDKKEVNKCEKIIAEWCKKTGFEMERDDFKKIIQKDVNNYIGIKSNGELKTKGGFVSLYKGGNYKTNSLQIIHRAIVDYLLYDIPVEKTINDCKDIFQFQQIVKTGGSFDGAYHYIDGKKCEIQKVNRVYAVKNKRYGQIVKGKWIYEKTIKGKKVKCEPPIWQENTIADCPDHAYCDNKNEIFINDLDMEYYINMAKQRIKKYITPTKKPKGEIEREIKIMANEKIEDIKNIYEKLMIAREMFLNSGNKKSGKNTYAEFKYFTLDDIIPKKIEIFNTLKLCDTISFTKDLATLTLINAENSDEKIEFTSQIEEDISLIKNPIQKVGAIQTYIRRYLYMTMLDIIESDAVEELTNKNETVAAEQPKKATPKTTEERQELAKELTENADITEIQKKSIMAGLKKLRATYTDENNNVLDEEKESKYEPFITKVVKDLRTKAITSKQQAEELLIEIGNKINE